MAQPAIPPERIRETIAFHGHNCPGVSIGIRVSELVQGRLTSEEDVEQAVGQLKNALLKKIAEKITVILE